jgi:methionine-rich copper-binding protein CopC
MRKILAISILLCTATAVHAQPAAAPKLTETDPAANAVVKAPVYMVHLMFDQPINIKSVTFDVTDRNGKPVDIGEPMSMGNDGKMLMALPNKPLAAGTYKVKWHATGPDGKPVEGEFSFTAR